MSRVGLTGRQAELLAFIQSETEAGRPAPSFGEMGRHLGLASRSSIHRLVTALEERGYIVRMPNRARAIGLVGEGQPPRSPLAPSSSRGVRFGLPVSVAERLVNYCDRRRVAYRDVLAAALDDYMDRHQ